MSRRLYFGIAIAQLETCFDSGFCFNRRKCKACREQSSDAADVLKAASGLTLSEALSRLKSPQEPTGAAERGAKEG